MGQQVLPPNLGTDEDFERQNSVLPGLNHALGLNRNFHKALFGHAAQQRAENLAIQHMKHVMVLEAKAVRAAHFSIQ